ncbi:MAG TPA: hypothetical protein VMJ33_06760 [Gallionella sp.]|nr:hypothetical protein [Gallionella sp.]
MMREAGIVVGNRMLRLDFLHWQNMGFAARLQDKQMQTPYCSTRKM